MICFCILLGLLLLPFLACCLAPLVQEETKDGPQITQIAQMGLGPGETGLQEAPLCNLRNLRTRLTSDDYDLIAIGRFAIDGYHEGGMYL